MTTEAQAKQLDEDRLSMISRLSQAVVDIPKKDMNEVKSYAKPPVGVKDVMTAALILLGEDNVDWHSAKHMLAKYGEESLQKQIASVDPETITPDRRKKAAGILSKYTSDQIAKISSATKAVFQWAEAVCEVD